MLHMYETKLYLKKYGPSSNPVISMKAQKLIHYMFKQQW